MSGVTAPAFFPGSTCYQAERMAAPFNLRPLIFNPESLSH
jgi:hypothetical protein